MELTSFFEYPNEIIKIIDTTNAVEGYHRMVRKFTKTKAIFPTDDSIRKAIYEYERNLQEVDDACAGLGACVCAVLDLF